MMEWIVELMHVPILVPEGIPLDILGRDQGMASMEMRIRMTLSLMSNRFLFHPNESCAIFSACAFQKGDR